MFTLLCHLPDIISRHFQTRPFFNMISITGQVEMLSDCTFKKQSDHPLHLIPGFFACYTLIARRKVSYLLYCNTV